MDHVIREELTFPLFFAVWAEIQGWTVPDFHWQIIQYLEDYKSWNMRTGVLQVFRDGAKSTIVALFVVYMLVKDPSFRFLILSGTNEMAIKLSRDCRSIIKRHPHAIHLRGREHKWQEHKFEVVGNTDARNQSVAAYGVMTNITASRADFIIYDDVEQPKNVATAEGREGIRERMAEAVHVLVPGGHQLLIGTPHAYESLYPEWVDMGASSLKLPLIINPEGEYPNIVGESRWPLRFTNEEIALRQKLSKKKNNFLSQYQLLPMTVDDSLLDLSLLKVYEEEIDFYWSNEMLLARLGDTDNAVRIANVCAFWDPSLTKAKGDDSVLAIVFEDYEGHYYIHRTIALEGDADEQCLQIKGIIHEFLLPAVSVETNGIGGFLPGVLLKHTKGMGVGIDDVYTSKSKGQKISEALEGPLYSNALHVHSSVMNTPFPTQFRDFKPSNKNEKDDFIDSVASAIVCQPIRISQAGVVSNAIRRWNTSMTVGEAEVEYTTLG